MQGVFTRLALCAAVVVAFGVVAGQALAAGNVTISQVYGGGGNAGAAFKNDFIELYNPGSTAVDLSSSSVQYGAATGTTWQLTKLTGTIPAGGYYLVQEAQGAGGTTNLPTPNATGTIAMAAGAGKVALVAGQTALTGACPLGPTVTDFVGFGTGTNCFEGTAAAPAPSNTTADLRKLNGAQDTNDNAADFQAGAPNPRNSAPANVPVVNCPGAQTVVAGSSTTFGVTASDVDGRVTNIADGASVTRTAFSPSLALGATASATFATSTSLAPGSYTITITATNDDATPQSGSCNVSLTVTPATIVTIGAVQGSVPDSYNGGAFNSSYVNQTVNVDGVVTEQTLEGGNHAFFLQNTPAQADGDPNSSDGIFVFLGHFTTLIGGYTPVVGDEIVMHAKVQEFSGQTELSSATFDRLVAHNVTVAPFAASPPADSNDAARYWERHEGMFGSVARGGTVDSPVHTYASTNDTEFYVLAPDSPVSGRSDPYAVRAFRDAHPLDDQPGLFDNGNGYRILVTDEGVKALAGGDVPLTGVHTFQTVAQPISGGVYYDFGKYSISADAQPQVAEGNDPSQNDPPASFDRTKAFSLANFNMENLYDFRNDPFDGCDFTGDPGCPGVTPPFDYPPASDAVYQARETAIAHQVVNDLHSPDVISIAEAEDQDICTVVDWAMSCGSTNNADGQPDTVQEVAVHIHALGGPDYAAAYDRDGADARGIVSAFLYRTDRVSLATPNAGDAVLGSSPTVSYRGTASSYNTQVSNPKSLNAALPSDVDTSTGVDGSNVFTRAPQVGHFLIWKSAVGTGYAQDVWVLANHFTSGPDSNVGQRREQAAYNAAIVAAIQGQDPSARIDVGGDLNVYPRPDDPFPPPNTSDQLAPLYNAHLHDLFDSVLDAHPSSAYSYDYQGQAQDLDHQFVSPALFDDLVAVNEAHINSDWTPGGAFANRGTSDHDPMVSRWALNGPPAVSAGGPYTVGEGSSVNLTATGTDPDGDALTYRWDLDNDGVFETTGQTVPFDATAIDGPAERTVAVEVSDGKLTSTDKTVVHVTNVAPTAAISGAPASSPEGTPVTATGSATDPAAADTLTYAWSVTKNGAAYASGDGTGISFTPDDNGTYVISFTATDDDGGVDTASSTVDVTNVAPTASVTAPSSSAEGSVVTASASATDPGTADGTPTFAWSVTKDGASFASGTGSGISYTPNDNGTYVLTVTATDKDGGAGTASATTQVTNVDPTATFHAPSSAVSGSTFTISFSDPADASSVDAASLTFAFDCGSGFGAYGSAQSRTCTAAYDGTQAVAGRVRDKDGGTTTYNATVHITVTVDSVCALVQSLAKNAGQANSLCVKLQHGQIDAFGHEVDAQTGKAFTADQAALLKRLAAQL